MNLNCFIGMSVYGAVIVSIALTPIEFLLEDHPDGYVCHDVTINCWLAATNKFKSLVLINCISHCLPHTTVNHGYYIVGLKCDNEKSLLNITL